MTSISGRNVSPLCSSSRARTRMSGPTRPPARVAFPLTRSCFLTVWLLYGPLVGEPVSAARLPRHRHGAGPRSGYTDTNGNPLPVPIDPAEARLPYVAVTRAQHHLDLCGLSRIHRHPDGNPAAA